MRVGMRKAFLLGVVTIAMALPSGDAAFGQDDARPIDYQITDIRIVPIGAVPSPDVEALRGLVGREFTMITVTVGDPIELPAAAFDATRQQYNADTVMRWLAPRAQNRAVRVVGVTNVDLFSPGLNFVFSTAIRRGTAVVMSLIRLRDPEGRLSQERYRKVVLRALGFTFGFESNPDPACVMHYSNSLSDLDRKGTAWCGDEPQVLRRIQGQE